MKVAMIQMAGGSGDKEKDIALACEHLRQAKEQGRSLEEEGAEITVRFGFSENYQLR